MLSKSESAALEQALQIRFLYYALIKSACETPAHRWTALYQLRHKTSKKEIKKKEMFRLNPPFLFKNYNSLKEFNIKKKNKLKLFYCPLRLEGFCQPKALEQPQISLQEPSFSTGKPAKAHSSAPSQPSKDYSWYLQNPQALLVSGYQWQSNSFTFQSCSQGITEILLTSLI